MKHDCRRLIGIGILLATWASAGCSRSSTTRVAETESPDSLRITALALSDQLSTTYKHCDWPALAGLIAPEYLGTAPGVRWDAVALQREFPKIRLIDVRRDDFEVKLLAPGVLTLNEDATLQETYDGQDVSGLYRFTTIWAKRADRWRLLFEQELPLAAETGSTTP